MKRHPKFCVQLALTLCKFTKSTNTRQRNCVKRNSITASTIDNEGNIGRNSDSAITGGRPQGHGATDSTVKRGEGKQQPEAFNASLKQPNASFCLFPFPMLNGICQPFTAPAVKPLTIYFCRMIHRMRAGKLKIKDAAYKAP